MRHDSSVTEDDDRSLPIEGATGSVAVQDDDAAGDLVADDRLAMLEPAPAIARRFGMLLPVVAVSLAVHVALFLLFVLVVKEPTPVVAQQETPIEVVQETPDKPEPKKEAKATPVAPKPEEKPAEPEAPKAAQEPPPKPEAKPDDGKPAPQKQDAERAKPDLPAQTAKLEPQAPSQPDKAADEAKALKSLQDELAALKAQSADLQAQEAAQRQAQQQEAGKALGLLPDSFAAVAMPSLSADGEDPVTYQQAVYNLIAKAKKSGRVYVPGVAHVVFNIGAKGELLDVTLDHSSGNPVVDEEAVAIVRRAAPFPPPPPGSPRTFPAYMSFVADQ